MIDAQQWLDHAFDLAAAPKSGAPRQVMLRRSISAAYYALFHWLLRSATDELVGRAQSRSTAYALVYRAFEHGDMRQRAEESQRSTLGSKARAALGREAFSQDVRNAALAFITLQKKRHRADYDPSGRFALSEATDACQTAAQAMKALAAASQDERRLFLIYLLFGAR